MYKYFIKSVTLWENKKKSDKKRCTLTKGYTLGCCTLTSFGKESDTKKATSRTTLLLVSFLGRLVFDNRSSPRRNRC